MLPADEYERIYLAQGKEAADAAFDREMRKHDIRFLQVVIIVMLIVVMYTVVL